MMDSKNLKKKLHNNVKQRNKTYLARSKPAAFNDGERFTAEPRQV